MEESNNVQKYLYSVNFRKETRIIATDIERAITFRNLTELYNTTDVRFTKTFIEYLNDYGYNAYYVSNVSMGYKVDECV